MVDIDSNKQKAIQLLAKHTSGFIPNHGQIDQQVKYYSRGSSFQVYFTKEDIHIVLFEKRKKEKDDPIERIKQRKPIKPQEERKRKGWVVNIKLANPNADLKLYAQKEKKGKVNFFHGNDESKWKTNLATLEKVVYQNIWEDIDLIFLKKDGELKYEFVVKPGADPEDIQLQYTGIESLSIDEAGNAVIKTPLGDLIDKAPIAYQNKKYSKIDVKTSLAISTNDINTIKYQVDKEYNKEYPLVIDPGLVYSTYLGGTDYDDSYAITIDTTGHAYIIGTTQSFNFPITIGAFDTTYHGNSDVFVTKLTPDGSGLVYSTYLGGSDWDDGYGITVDTTGHTYVTGGTYSPNFPTTVGAFDTTYHGFADVFITKLTPDGSGLVYSTYLGGSDWDESGGITIDTTGHVYVTGYTESSNFPTTSGAFDTTYHGNGDVFVTKLTPDGSGLIYSTYLGGTDYDDGYSIAINMTGHAYVTGGTYSPNFPTTAGAFDTTYHGFADVFITKLTPDGSGLIYSTYLGGTGYDDSYSIAIDMTDHTYITGLTISSDFPATAGAFDTTYHGNGDVFLTKLTPDGSDLIYSTYLGGTGTDVGLDITIDTTGYAYVTGTTDSSNFPTTPEAYDTTYHGGYGDVFITKLTPDGSSLIYSTYLGGTDYDEGYGIAIDTTGHAHVTGLTYSSDFPTTLGAFDTTYHGNGDVYITKLNLNIEADLEITKTDDSNPVYIGNPLTYTLEVTNHGPDNATDVRVVDTLPATVTYLSSSTSQGSCSESSRVVTCNLGVILNGASATITIVVTPTTAGIITNTATVSGNEDDPNPDDNTVTDDTTVIAPLPEIVEYVITLGKIRQVIPTGRFKDELFKEMKKIRGLLDIWDIEGALKILYNLKNTVTKRIIKGYGNAIKLCLLLRDIERLEVAIKNISCRPSEKKCPIGWLKPGESSR